jgi:hypothetical protein
MEWLKKHLKSNPQVAISLPTVMCFIQFIYDLLDIFKSGHFDNTVFAQLISSANGFEAVVLCIIMLALKEKKK